EQCVRRQGQGRALGRGSGPRRRGGGGVATAARSDGPCGRIGNDGALVGGRLGDRVRLAPLEHHVVDGEAVVVGLVGTGVVVEAAHTEGGLEGVARLGVRRLRIVNVL